MQSTILVVDDEPDIRRTCRDLLETAGYRVKEAADGKEALRMARARPPDLILLDLKMPGASGHTVLKKLKADPGFKAPIMVVTGETDMANLAASIAEGVDAYMTKPFTRDQLLAKVTELLSRDKEIENAEDTAHAAIARG